MDRTSALIIAAFLALGILWAMIRGDAAAGQGLGRKDEPFAFWGIVAAMGAGLAAALVAAWRA